MKILSWNCCGMAAATTVNELKDLYKRNMPAIVFLLETRVRSHKVNNFKRKLGYKHAFTVDPIGLLGGLCLLWTNQIEI